MIFNVYLLYTVIVFFEIINGLPHRRFRRQIYPSNDGGLPNDPRSVRFQRPSGAIRGSAYYSAAADPNYGSYVAKPNRPSGSGIIPISYNSGSKLYEHLIKPSHRHQEQRQAYSLNNNYNRNNDWQGLNSNNYYGQYYNRYGPGNRGWYAPGGGHYWFNKGQSVIAHPTLLLTTIAILVFCK